MPQLNYWLHALSPIHVGTGTGVGFVDLPIVRESITNWPYVPGSAIKGVLASRQPDAPDSKDRQDLYRFAFGVADQEDETGESLSNSGALVFSDARLVCLPVRSLYGTFAWVTSPLALARLKRDMPESVKILPTVRVASDQIATPSGVTSLLVADKNVFLNDLDFSATATNEVKTCAETLATAVFPTSPEWQEEFRKRFAVVPDDRFTFLCETAVEVTPRVRLSHERKSVERGGLWYEEYLPAEAILSGIVWCDRIYAKKGQQPSVSPAQLFQKFCSGEATLQLGGKATIGKGRTRCVFGGANA